MDWNKALNSALEGIERNVVDQVREAASALEEYPGQDRPDSAAPLTDWSLAPKAIAAWRQLNLEGKKAGLLDHLARIKSEKSSRDKSVPSLIRRAEEAELALGELCNQLLQAPDPTCYLRDGMSSQDKIKELERENAKLQRDREAAEKEATTAGTLVTQAQQAGEAQAKLRKQLEEAEARIQGNQQEMAGVDALKAQHARLETELGQLRGSHQALQQEHQRVQNQLFDLRASNEAAASHQANDADVAALEHERALKRIRHLEHEGARNEERIQELLAERQTQSLPANGNREQHLTREVQRLEAELATLRKIEEESSPRDGGADASLQRAQQQIASLEAALAGRPTVEDLTEVQKQLRTAETLLDAQMAAEGPEAGSPGGAEAQGGGTDPTQSLVAILQARNRRLASDNGSMRQQAVALRQEVASLQASLQETEAAMRRKEELQQQLEADLATSTQLLDKGAASSGEGGGGSQAAGSMGPASGGMLQIVGSQRDRFKARVHELEQEVGTCRQDLSGATTRLQQLEKDNVGLYERIRYLQRYQGSQSGEQANSAYKIVNVDSAGVRQNAAASHRMSCGPFQMNLGADQGGRMRSRNRNARFSCLGGGDGDEEAGPRSELEQRYAKAYESKINPFAEFQASEREERLPTHEKALLAGSKLILSNRPGRIFAVIYFVAVHIFLFCLVYHIMLTSVGYVAATADTAAS